MIKYLSLHLKQQSTLLFFTLFLLKTFGEAKAIQYKHEWRLPSGYATMESITTESTSVKTNDQYGKTQTWKSNLHKQKKGDVTSSYLPTIGGPGQPEMSSFKSVGADNMVNLFTGDFSYNIPLLDVGGYPINIFYNAGITMDQEASWVGLGWNINPGTISRNMRGLPDDFNGDQITKVQSLKNDLTVGVSAGLNTEVTGMPVKAGSHAGIFWNNRKGVSMEIGGDFSVHTSITKKSQTEKTTKDTVGQFSVTGGVNLNSQNGLSLNAGLDVEMYKSSNALLNGVSTSADYNSRTGINSLKIEGESNLYKKYTSSIDPNASVLPDKLGSSISFARSSFTPLIRMPLTRYNGNLKIKIGGAATTVHQNGYITGSLTNTYLAEKDRTQQKPAYGYMYYEKADDKSNALMDFNRLNDGTYTLKTPVISIPNYTYDVFSISGEGTGGSFRGYRGNMGFVRDNFTSSREGSFSLSADAGAGFLLHGGIEIGGIYSHNEVDDWVSNNALRNTIRFTGDSGMYQGFYFKNPGEKAIIDENYYNAIGGDELVRPKLQNLSLALPLAASSFELFDGAKKYKGDVRLTVANSTKNIRDKRTQIISYLNAEQAERVGLDNSIYSYTENIFKPNGCANNLYKTRIRRYNPGDENYYRKAHHLSEIDVLESDGKRYVYGLPAYTLLQKDVSFSINNGQGNQETGLTSILANQNTIANSSGREANFQSETIPAYAHSFLLTAILSPDYIDVSGDGITDDDPGTAVKFNYTRVNKLATNSWYPQKWRTPVDLNTAHYNSGLKTDNADDKGLYSYGEKELWYTHSIETKNMVATFTLSNRDDGKQVNNEAGGITAAYGQRKLEKIDLYTKADYNKNGSAAKPVKSIHFAYSYTLCTGAKNNIHPTGGKLTLDSLWFSYNGNYKQTRNKYRFKYAAGRAGITANPTYNGTQNDRWGSYKDNKANPEGVSNADYPYTLQKTEDTLKNNVYASAWNLEKIMLPAGAVISVGYEADDYAYVQNKRAAQMTRIAGFGNSPDASPVNSLYTYNSTPAFFSHPGKMDNQFVFFDVDEPVTSKEDIQQKYLDGIDQLLLKLSVEMPANSYGSGYEPVMIYSTIKDYFLVPGNSKRICVQMNPSAKGGSKIMETVIQFLKDNLPSKAYKGYDVGNQNGLRQIVSAVQGMAQEFFNAVEGFENNLKSNNKCRLVKLDQSYGRLDNPFYRKFGGGHRVKSIVISDNWKKMVSPNSTEDLDSYYGQIYDYSTTAVIKGIKKTISSGVATYEPGIGNEENPFREILQYSEKQPLGPTNISNIELPVTESFFPSPSVGYSRVAVKSIHNKENKNLKSGVGVKEVQYYTCKDFPVISDFTDFDSRSRSHYKPNLISRILFQQNKDFLTLSQGFRVILNDMNGKIKSEATYPETDLASAVNKTNYYYRLANTSGNTYKLQNNVKVITGSNGIVREKIIGKEVEVMNDFRHHYSCTQSAQIPLNVDAFTIGIIPVVIPSILKAFFRDESIYRSATTLKIITDYGILDSIVNVDKGSIVSTRQMVYDGETGEPLISRTNNEFNKPVYSLNYPSHWVNSGMDLAYKNIDATFSGLKFTNGILLTAIPGGSGNFESGDEIYVLDKSNADPANNEACINSGDPATLPKSEQYKIWAVATSKDNITASGESYVFIDRYGNPYSANNATIRIIRSGKRNMTGTSVGSITSLENPLHTVGLVEKIDITSNSNVLNASATEFKERWKVQDAFYSKDTTINVTKWSKINTGYFYTTNSHGYSEYHEAETHTYNTHFSETVDPAPFLARQKSFGNKTRWTWWRDRSWILFDLNVVRADATILSAKLALYAHRKPFTAPDVYHPFFWNGSHHSPDPHHSDITRWNSFRLSRMQSKWPSDRSPEWKNLYFDEGKSGGENESFQIGPFTPTQDLIKLPSSDYRPDITSMFEAMLRDKFDPLKQFATGLKINLTADDNTEKEEARVCFYGRVDLNGKPYGGPFIEAKYTYCSEADAQIPSGGNPNDYFPCITAETGRHCFSVFAKKQLNPYVAGLLGNWRPFRSYTFYSDRKENNFNNTTNIKSDGAIADFQPFWIISDGYLKKTTSNKWIWNSEVTQINRKGVEIENRDPLNRYNSGVYGYQETLPIVVANNAKVREIAFDGFEDHNYKDAVCENLCQPSKRHFSVGNVASNLSSTQHHSGKYSLKVGPNSQHDISSIVIADDTTLVPSIRIKLDSSLNNQVVVNPRGKGLKRIYYSFDNFTGYTSEVAASPVSLALSGGCGGVIPVPVQEVFMDGSCSNFSIKWRGLLQASYSGTHSFWLSKILDDVGTLTIRRRSDNIIIYTYSGDLYPQTPPTSSVNLSKGELYNIEVTLRNFRGYYGIDLQWKTPGSVSFVPVPLANLYPEGMEYLANNTVTPVGTSWCVKADTIQAIKSVLIDSFSLIPGKKYVLSAWVKEDEVDCKCTGYTFNAIQLVYNRTMWEPDWKPTGNIIEGWQRYENEFTVPPSATSLVISLKSWANKNVYFDDLRIHPFNSNIKTFVYNPENLRLSAELDENNYATFYEYDDEGVITRIKKETKDGIKTIKETRSALQHNISLF